MELWSRFGDVVSPWSCDGWKGDYYSVVYSVPLRGVSVAADVQ